MESATKKQKNYARDISELLKIPLPEQDDLTAYSEFIETHIREYHKEKRRRYRQNELQAAELQEAEKDKPSVLEVEPRLYLQTVQERYTAEQLATPEAAVRFLQDYMKSLATEMIVVINLDVDQRVINYSRVSIGTIGSARTSGRELFKTAILSNAAGILICHNHLGTRCMPSPEDIALTQQMVQAGHLLGIPLLDHIIIGSERSDGLYFSFRESQPAIFLDDSEEKAAVPSITFHPEGIAAHS